MTSEAFLFHHLGATSSYEVSLMVAEPERSRLRHKLQLGRFYNYVGRLLRYDGMFRVIVLEQGSVLHADDLGVPGTLPAASESARSSAARASDASLAVPTSAETCARTIASAQTQP